MTRTGVPRQSRVRGRLLLRSHVWRRLGVAEIVAQPDRAARSRLRLRQELRQLVVIELTPALGIAYEPFLARRVLEAEPAVTIAIRQVGPVALRADLPSHLED